MSQEAFRAMLKDRPLTREEWTQLAEERFWSIKPHLKYFTLEELGQVRVLVKKTGNGSGFLQEDNPKVVGDDGRGLKFQGIFNACCPKREVSGENSAVIRFWGVSRSGDWILVRVVVTLGEKFHPRTDIREEKAEVVEIQVVDLQTILRELEKNPFNVWDALGLAIQSWETDRKKIYDIAHELATVVRFGERLRFTLPHESGT